MTGSIIALASSVVFLTAALFFEVRKNAGRFDPTFLLLQAIYFAVLAAAFKGL